MKITRRHVLALTVAGAGAAALGAGGLIGRWWDRPAGEGLRALSQREYEVAQALAEAWMPPGGTPAISGAEAEVGRYLDAVIASTDPTTGKLLKALLEALDDKPFLFRGVPFRRLPLAERSALLAAWLRHDNALFRGAVSGLMALIAMGYTLHPEVSTALGPLFGCGYGA